MSARWKIVPRTHTNPMHDAGVAEYASGTMSETWEAMLAAAPRASEDAELVEEVAKAIYVNAHRGLKSCWEWDDSGLDDEHPGARDRYLRDARAVLRYLEGSQ